MFKIKVTLKNIYFCLKPSKKEGVTVAYPEGFRCRYTGLGAQTMCPNY